MRWFAISLLLGALCALNLTQHWLYWGGIGLASLVIVLAYTCYRYSNKAFSLFCLIGIGFLFGLLRSSWELNQYAAQRVTQSVKLDAQFIVTEIRPHSTLIKIINSNTWHGGQLLTYDLSMPVTVGSTWQAQLNIKPLLEADFPDKRSRALFWVEHGIVGQTQINHLHALAPAQGLHALKQQLQSAMHHAAPKAAASLITLTLGEQTGLTTDQWRTLRRTGTSHLMAISGLHIGLVAMWMFILVRLLSGLCGILRPTPDQIAAISALVVAALYTLLAGASLPTLRSLIMLSVVMAALVIRRNAWHWHTLALAASIIILLNPLAVASISFWLSFGALFILFGLARKSIGSREGAHFFQHSRIALLIKMQCLLSLCFIPFTAYFFGEVSLISPIINLIAIPWIALLVLPQALLGILAYPFSSAIAYGLWQWAGLFMDSLWAVLAYCAHFDYAAYSWKLSSFWMAISLTLGLIWMLRPSSWRIRLLALCALFSFLPWQRKVTANSAIITVLPVGNGLAVLVQTAHSQLLFDTGSNYFGGFDTGERIVVPALQALDIKQIDTLILSHNSTQHLGGTRSIREHFTIQRILTYSPEHIAIDHTQPCYPQYWQIDGVTFRSLSTPEQQSCALSIHIGNQNIWLLSDLSQSAFTTLRSHNAPPQALLMPNQGMSTQHTQTLLSFNPRPITILSSVNPAPKLIQQLNKHNINWYNAQIGTVQLHINSEEITVKQLLTANRYWWWQ